MGQEMRYGRVRREYTRAEVLENIQRFHRRGSCHQTGHQQRRVAAAPDAAFRAASRDA